MAPANSQIDAQDIEAANILLQLQGSFTRAVERRKFLKYF